MKNTNKIIPGCGFQHVAVKVHDLEAASKFYRALGMTEALSWGEGDTQGVLLDTGDGNYIEIFAGGTPEPKPTWGEGAALIHIALRTTDVDGATATAEKAGATITRDPCDITIGNPGGKQVKVRLSFVQAPGGEVVEFFDSKEL